MTLRIRRQISHGLAVILISGLAACATVPDSNQLNEAENPGIGILFFGDSGYHLGYLDADDYEDKFTEEEFRQEEWDSWLEDKRPPDEFKVRPYAVSPATGGVVIASGMQAISQSMKNFCREDAACDFGLMLGDNIYPEGPTLGADGIPDEKRYRDTISDPFGNLVEKPGGFVIYGVHGNHDWKTSREGGFAEIKFMEKTEGFFMDGPFYTVKPAAGKGQIELFVVDTSMILDSVPVLADSLNDDGSEASTGELEDADYNTSPLTEAEKAMPEWLERSLRESTARWKIVVAHHPIWSSSGSKFEQARALRKVILPALCRYADVYLVGHDHTLEIHTDDCAAALGAPTDKPLVQIVSGAASKQRPLNTNFMHQQNLKYPGHQSVFAKGLLWGFSHMQIEGDTASVTMLSIPDDGSAGHSVVFEYTFERRSHLTSP